MSDFGQILISPRVAIHQELEQTRQQFHSLVASLDELDLYLPSGNPAWSISETLYQIILVLGLVRMEVACLRLGLRYPQTCAPAFTRLITTLTRLGSRNQTRAGLVHAYDREYERTVKTLRQVSEYDWQIGRQYFDFSPPILDGVATIEDLFHYPAKHLEAYEKDIRQGLARLEQVPSTRLAEEAPPALPDQGCLMSYPTHPLHKALFKAPIILWRLGLGTVLGQLLMLISHTGRKSGRTRRTMVEYHTIAGRKYVPCAFGPQSDWYQNMTTNPNVTIQTSRGAESVRAERVTDERELLAVYNHLMHKNPLMTQWYLESLDIQPEITDLLAKKDRVYWLRFDPIEAPTPPPQRADLVFIWLFALAGGVLGWLLARRKRK
jgi:deazaflavin-dependent oxidoreductase (nitroreductase family)